MPLSLSTEELDLLLALAAPIDHRNRDQFLHEVAAELEAAADRTGIRARPWRGASGGAHGSETVFRPAATAQRDQTGARLEAFIEEP